MPTLVQFNSVANWGSTGRLAEDIGDVAMAAGWESYIAFGRQYNPSKSHLLQIGNKWSILSHTLKSRLLDRQGFGSYWATKRLLQKLDEIKPDVFQFHNVHGYYLNLPLILKYANKKNIPIVWSLHDCWSMTGHCAHFVKIGCEKWKTQCAKCPLKAEYPTSWLLDCSRKNYLEKKRLIQAVPRLSVISGSQWLADVASQSFFKGRNIHVIADGIDIDIYQPRINGDELRKKLGLEGKFVILATGTSWGDDKGLSDYGKLREMLSDDYAIVLVGMTQEWLEKVPEGVIGLPRTKTPVELSDYYSMADCVMSLSRMESFGLTIVEGFACGTPAIDYDTTALPELITPETGLIATFLDVEDVKKKVEIMRAKGKSSYSKKCREVAVEQYGRTNCYHKYMNVYKSLLSQ
jgi:glycosyltransferase involved in cell wall biosynthesis